MATCFTRQVYNLFQDLWNRFINIGGGVGVQISFDAIAVPTVTLLAMHAYSFLLLVSHLRLGQRKDYPAVR